MSDDDVTSECSCYQILLYLQGGGLVKLAQMIYSFEQTTFSGFFRSDANHVIKGLPSVGYHAEVPFRNELTR